MSQDEDEVLDKRDVGSDVDAEEELEDIPEINEIPQNIAVSWHSQSSP